MARRILIIDDSEHMRSVLRLTLEFQGYEVIEAENGREALERVDEGIDLIFSDIEMPEMNGLEFVRRYRATHGAAVPIVMLTAEEGEQVRQVVSAGANAVIHKPFEPIRLMEELGRFLS